MKSTIVVLATLLPMAMSSAVPADADAEIDLSQKQELSGNSALRCQLGSSIDFKNVPCGGAPIAGSLNNGQAIFLRCQNHRAPGTTWYKTKSGTWVANVNCRTGNVNNLPECDI
ncbi:uncharacterized protein BO95DRAFT_466508 [Aspergillus brunneoviolaceus CBS 621.78]|uniref:Uncharacterized protein n=1 Tax=Aspergillus brunneoviolaceus CBS 621.78 TaxID=1450534 RepID=A0ACD1G121_9EURO|nr:hypothetical protein BO95DRAFT_466508 [Aspergillus brunneoviolaceus CBS 621.78]RAH42907.1 hypothetical protein BO95DRAFT_466508 [Aspergillus brunneoviolaceus CBS 621.78]